MPWIFIGLLFLVLFLLCGFVTLIILMQRPSANAGMGAALGGGAAEQAFGGETGNILTRWTVYSIIGFFVVCLILYLLVIGQTNSSENGIQIESLRGVGAEEVLPEEVGTTALPGASEVVDEILDAEPTPEATDVPAESVELESLLGQPARGASPVPAKSGEGAEAPVLDGEAAPQLPGS